MSMLWFILGMLLMYCIAAIHFRVHENKWEERVMFLKKHVRELETNLANARAIAARHAND